MKKVRVGVIGCGGIAQNRHLPEYNIHQNVEITAVCDIHEDRARKIADNYGASAFTSFEELINSGLVDAVSVCTSNDLHAPVSIAALEAGLHVLCEKPMATSKQAAEEMIAVAERSGKKLMIAHNQRFIPSHQKARRLIESVEIGRIYSFRTTFGHGGPELGNAEGKNSWFFQKERAFVGAMGDLGVHKSDLLRYLLGEEIVEVGSFVETSAKDFANVDDNAVCILKTESGIIGTLAASWTYAGGENNSTIIYGEKAILRLEDDPIHSLIVQYATGEVVKHDFRGMQSNNSHVIEQFVESIQLDLEPPISGHEGLKSLQVILAALESSRTGQIVKVGTEGQVPCPNYQ
ncbi:Gfo/Idh/MocA family protein [Neobacillus mesonae]|uniref:Gfo/Idh/MocA family protein n=1 Tax=Neobacillus mesonae TaxID=1193713 RepID=UPI0008355976|nr:Gfo/Idh/MocA family oxidoreductase [Neobacillus mesonae]